MTEMTFREKDLGECRLWEVWRLSDNVFTVYCDVSKVRILKISNSWEDPSRNFEHLISMSICLKCNAVKKHQAPSQFRLITLASQSVDSFGGGKQKKSNFDKFLQDLHNYS